MTQSVGVQTAVQTLRVLVGGGCLFDRADIRQLVQSLPERLWELTEVQNGDAIVRAVLNDPHGPPDCLLLNDSLDEADILGLLANLASPQGGCVCPVVVFSSAKCLEKAQAVVRAGAQDYVVKDWLKPSGLAWVIHNAIERWSMQRQLRDRAMHLQLAVQASLAITFEWDIVHDRVRRLQSVKDALPNTEGDTFEGVVRLLHPEDRALFRANVQAALSSADGKYHSEYRVVQPDGEAFWLEESGRVEFDVQSRPVRLIGVAFDITQRKQAEEALRQSEARFRAVQQTTPDGFMLLQSVRNDAGQIIDFEFRYVNPAAERLVRRTDLVGKRLLEEMPGNREAGLFNAYIQVTETGEVWQREFRYCHEGMDCWFRITATKTADGFAASFIDITERKQSEESLRMSEKNFRAMFELASVGKAQADPVTGRFERVNSAFCKITGYSEAELLQRTIGDITYPEDYARNQALFASMVRGEIDTFSSEKRFVRRDGSICWVQFDANLISDSEGRPYRAAAVIQDITARKQVEDALAEQKRLY